MVHRVRGDGPQPHPHVHAMPERGTSTPKPVLEKAEGIAKFFQNAVHVIGKKLSSSYKIKVQQSRSQYLDAKSMLSNLIKKVDGLPFATDPSPKSEGVLARVKRDISKIEGICHKLLGNSTGPNLRNEVIDLLAKTEEFDKSLAEKYHIVHLKQQSEELEERRANWFAVIGEADKAVEATKGRAKIAEEKRKASIEAQKAYEADAPKRAAAALAAAEVEAESARETQRAAAAEVEKTRQAAVAALVDQMHQQFHTLFNKISPTSTKLIPLRGLFYKRSDGITVKTSLNQRALMWPKWMANCYREHPDLSRFRQLIKLPAPTKSEVQKAVELLKLALTQEITERVGFSRKKHPPCRLEDHAVYLQIKALEETLSKIP